jgi:hypothetical protein
MNRGFDYNGTVVSQSKPVRQLKTAKKVLMIDSADRDTTKYYTNGEFTVYLPRVYENVVSVRLMAAEFPPLVSQTNSPPNLYGAQRINYTAIGNNLSSTTGYTDRKVASADNQFYFLIDIEGLNKTDETTVGGNRSTFPDGFFAKIPVTYNSTGVQYNDHSAQENIAHFKPALGKLDRLHIRTRLHNQQDNSGFIYWTTNGLVASGSNQKGAEFSLSLEIEYLENSFDDFSSFETRVSERA